jgi:hypothetical protein
VPAFAGIAEKTSANATANSNEKSNRLFICSPPLDRNSSKQGEVSMPPILFGKESNLTVTYFFSFVKPFVRI